eukprot:362326-Chlamydomonas_euryale.AAC.5
MRMSHACLQAFEDELGVPGVLSWQSLWQSRSDAGIAAAVRAVTLAMDYEVEGMVGYAPLGDAAPADLAALMAARMDVRHIDAMFQMVGNRS